MIKVLIIGMLTAGCIIVNKEPEKKIIFVDKQTYSEWGTIRLNPINKRRIPTQSEIDNNPLWQYSSPDRAYERRQEKRLQRHREAVRRHQQNLRRQQ